MFSLSASYVLLFVSSTLQRDLVSRKLGVEVEPMKMLSDIRFVASLMLKRHAQSVILTKMESPTNDRLLFQS